MACKDCQGRGWLSRGRCRLCHGSGQREETLQVSVLLVLCNLRAERRRELYFCEEHEVRPLTLRHVRA